MSEDRKPNQIPEARIEGKRGRPRIECKITWYISWEEKGKVCKK